MGYTLVMPINNDDLARGGQRATKPGAYATRPDAGTYHAEGTHGQEFLQVAQDVVTSPLLAGLAAGAAAGYYSAKAKFTDRRKRKPSPEQDHWERIARYQQSSDELRKLRKRQTPTEPSESQPTEPRHRWDLPDPRRDPRPRPAPGKHRHDYFGWEDRPRDPDPEGE